MEMVDIILQLFPEFSEARDVYVDEFDNDVTPICIDLSRFAEFVWEQSKYWSDDDFKILWRLIQDLTKLGDQHICDCIDTGFMEALDGKAIEETQVGVIFTWISNMPEFAYTLSPEWRERRRRSKSE